MTRLEPCPGCGGRFVPAGGPVHSYMISSPACWAAFGKVMAAEYQDPGLMAVHRLSVDAFAVQHPGDGSQRAIQSVGMHLARLQIQLSAEPPQAALNDIMQGFSARKASLPPLKPPERFAVTVADVAPLAGLAEHASAVRRWARSAWDAWSEHHEFIGAWAGEGRR